MWAATRWTAGHSFKAALPTSEMQNYNDGRGVVYGMLIFHNDSLIDFKDVSSAQLPGASQVRDYGVCDDAGATWAAVHFWAYQRNYPAGFRDFEHTDYGQGQVYGSLLV